MKLKCKKCGSETMHIERKSDCSDCEHNGAWDEDADNGNGDFIYDQKKIEILGIKRDEAEENGTCEIGENGNEGCFICTCAECDQFVEHIWLDQ